MRSAPTDLNLPKQDVAKDTRGTSREEKPKLVEYICMYL